MPGPQRRHPLAFFELSYGYGIAEVVGFRGGYSGLDPSPSVEPVTITPGFVDDIHQKGGTILGSSRGPVDIDKAVDNLISRGINILFTVGGDGTQRGANALYQEARRRGHALSVVGVPKTIDNDVGFVSRTFGFSTAIESPRASSIARTRRLEAFQAASDSSNSWAAMPGLLPQARRSQVRM